MKQKAKITYKLGVIYLGQISNWTRRLNLLFISAPSWNPTNINIKGIKKKNYVNAHILRARWGLATDPTLRRESTSLPESKPQETRGQTRAEKKHTDNILEARIEGDLGNGLSQREKPAKNCRGGDGDEEETEPLHFEEFQRKSKLRSAGRRSWLKNNTIFFFFPVEYS